MADERGLDIGQSEKSNDSVGNLDIRLLTDRGYVAVNRTPGGFFDVAVRHFGDLTAWGRTAELSDVAETLHRWHGGAEVAELLTGLGYLHASDDFGDGALVQAAWRWLLDYGFDDVQPLVRALHAEPALRALLPRISGHGTLQLADAPTASEARTLGFFPLSEGGWRVVEYGVGAVGDVADVSEAAKLAAGMVRTEWND